MQRDRKVKAMLDAKTFFYMKNIYKFGLVVRSKLLMQRNYAEFRNAISL